MGAGFHFQKAMTFHKQRGSPAHSPLPALSTSFEILESLRTSCSKKGVQRQTHSDAKTLWGDLPEYGVARRDVPESLPLTRGARLEKGDQARRW